MSLAWSSVPFPSARYADARPAGKTVTHGASDFSHERQPRQVGGEHAQLELLHPRCRPSGANADRNPVEARHEMPPGDAHGRSHGHIRLVSRPSLTITISDKRHPFPSAMAALVPGGAGPPLSMEDRA